MEEKRFDESSQFCPDHDKVYRIRQDDILCCVAYGCSWQCPARRVNDKEVKTLGQIRKEQN